LQPWTSTEVPFQGLTPGTNDTAVPCQGSTPANVAHSAVDNSEGANDNVSEFNGTHLSAITVNGDDESHLSAITADSVHEAQPHLFSTETDPTGMYFPNATPQLAMEWCRVPPVADPRVCPTNPMQGYETPPCVAPVDCQTSSRFTYSCNTVNPVEHRLSAVSPRDAAGSLGESGPCGPVPVTAPTADGGWSHCKANEWQDTHLDAGMGRYG
jgi:hypothetical protein